MVSANMSDTEYLGSYVTQITHYDPWDEMVQVENTIQVPCGTDSNGNTIYTTEVYYTWEREYHSDKWSFITNDFKYEQFCSKEEYEKIKQRLNSHEVFRDMKRDYYKIDGDAHDMFWDRTPNHIYDITREHNYNNRIKAVQSNTIFKYGEISKNKAKELELFDYPANKDGHQSPILGRTVTDAEEQYIRYLNGTLGKEKEFRMYILFFDNKDLEISEMQKAYWQGGNKNEFVVCIGTQKDSVVWSNAFSWCDKPKLEVATRQYFIENPKVNLVEYGKFIKLKINSDWERKEFTDFKYIKVGLTKGQYAWLLFIMLAINAGISLYIIGNDFENRIKDDIKNKRY